MARAWGSTLTRRPGALLMPSAPRLPHSQASGRRPGPAILPSHAGSLRPALRGAAATMSGHPLRRTPASSWRKSIATWAIRGSSDVAPRAAALRHRHGHAPGPRYRGAFEPTPGLELRNMQVGKRPCSRSGGYPATSDSGYPLSSPCSARRSSNLTRSPSAVDQQRFGPREVMRRPRAPRAPRPARLPIGCATVAYG